MAVILTVFIMRTITVLVRPITILNDWVKTKEDFEKSRDANMMLGLLGWIIAVAVHIAFGAALWTMGAV